MAQVPIVDQANGRLDIARLIGCDQPFRQAQAPVEGLVDRFKQVGALHAHPYHAIEQDIDNAIAIAKGVGIEAKIAIGNHLHVGLKAQLGIDTADAREVIGDRFADLPVNNADAAGH